MLQPFLEKELFCDRLINNKSNPCISIPCPMTWWGCCAILAVMNLAIQTKNLVKSITSKKWCSWVCCVLTSEAMSCSWGVRHSLAILQEDINKTIKEDKKRCTKGATFAITLPQIVTASTMTMDDDAMKEGKGDQTADSPESIDNYTKHYQQLAFFNKWEQTHSPLYHAYGHIC